MRENGSTSFCDDAAVCAMKPKCRRLNLERGIQGRPTGDKKVLCRNKKNKCINGGSSGRLLPCSAIWDKMREWGKCDKIV